MGESREPFTIAIIGGGIGGLFAALSLHHFCAPLGITIDVYEQASEYKEIGAGVGIGVNAARLIHKLGLGGAANRIAGDRNGIWLAFRRGDNGEEIVTVPVNDRDDIKQLPVQRSEFLDLLLDAIRERKAATLHTNKKCKHLTDLGSKTLLNFTDSTTATANLIIAADGIHSPVRAQFASHNNDRPQYSGKIVYRGLVPIPLLESWWPLPTYAASWLAPDKHLLVFPISSNAQLNVVAFVSIEEKELAERGLRESWTAEGTKEEVEGCFEGFDGAARRLLGLLPEKVSLWVVNEREPLGRWVYWGGRVVLLGDAAHAMSPHQGEFSILGRDIKKRMAPWEICGFLSSTNFIQGAGAGQAIEDGYILGRALQDYLKSSSKDLSKWMEAYQTLRLPRAQRAQKTSREAGEVYELQAEGLKDKTFEECMPELRNRLKNRMDWVWTEDLDAMYEKVAVDIRD